MSLSLAELKKLHDKGLSLIWLRPKSKRPWELKWTSGPRHSWELLENSFEKDNNVGVRLGAPSKLISGCYLGAIDCDVKSKSREAIKEMNEKLRELGIDLSSAPIVMSGRGNGSKHVYVQTKEPIERGYKFATSTKIVKVLMAGESKPHSNKEVEILTNEERKQGYRLRPAWEIAVMGTGQQVVLPPSIHPDSGMKYAWSSPLTVKHLPVFFPENFTAQRQEKKASQGDKPTGLQFKACEVDLWGSKLSPAMIRLIEDGTGCQDRSASLLAVAMSMCRTGFTDNEILSVLSNPNYWLAQAAYDRRRGRRSAVEWLYTHTLLKARHETHVMRYFDNPPTRAARLPVTKKKAAQTRDSLSEDLKQALPDRTNQGKPQASLRNIIHVLEHYLGGGLVGLNEFSNRVYFLKDTPYGGKKGEEVSDFHDVALKHYVACHYQFEPAASLCFEAHMLLARKYRFHPIREYLASLEWDGVPRLDSWLTKAFNVTGPDEYIKAIARKTLVAAVKRVFNPGCKFDHVLVLEGNQGEGKSMSLSILATPAWFTDGLGDIHNKDVVDQMAGKWMIELSELASIRGRESEHVKAFLTRQVDRVRMSYGRRSEDYPRQSVFIGTTNAFEYFTDESGNRRYWPARVGEANTVWLKKHRDQLWAEAMMRFELGEDLYLTKEVEAIARKEQEKRFEVDDWETSIKVIVKDDAVGDTHTTNEIFSALSITGMPTMADSKRIGRIMVRLGFRRTAKRLNGVLGRCWIKQ